MNHILIHPRFHPHLPHPHLEGDQQACVLHVWRNFVKPLQLRETPQGGGEAADWDTIARALELFLSHLSTSPCRASDAMLSLPRELSHPRSSHPPPEDVAGGSCYFT